MESKYYTPKIEEFHVGFEFYVEGYKQEFFKAFVKPDIFCRPDLLKKYIEDKSYKVKYLDKEDIESLGFKQITDNCFNLPIREDELRLLYEDDKIVIFFADRYSDMLFRGIIKNKSELKKLLIQLSILEDGK